MPALPTPNPAAAGIANVEIILPPLNDIPADNARNLLGNNSE